uniref:Uncharacterized protein n=1 Tax=Hucho hucho TaxID=62062 RepID=A0A4W5LV97_9TELE
LPPRGSSTTGSLCSGLFSASVLGVSSSAPNLRDYVRTHHRKPPLSPGLPFRDELFSMPAVKRFSVSFARHPTNGMSAFFQVYLATP